MKYFNSFKSQFILSFFLILLAFFSLANNNLLARGFRGGEMRGGRPLPPPPMEGQFHRPPPGEGPMINQEGERVIRRNPLLEEELIDQPVYDPDYIPPPPNDEDNGNNNDNGQNQDNND